MNAMEGRIMEAVADYGKWCGTSRWVEVSEERRAMFAHIAALVAEACAPQPERVCRWRHQGERDDWYKQECTGDGYGYIPGAFCPECGGRVEVVADGQKGGGMMEYEGEFCSWSPPGTLQHDLDKFAEALRELSRQVEAAARRDWAAFLLALFGTREIK